jgi:hypothetical protein
MPAIQRITDRLALVDLVALDRDDRPVLIVGAEEQKAEPIILAAYREVLKAIRRDIPFAILADAETMTIYRKDRTRSLEPVATIPTRDILSFYDPNFQEGRMFKDYIVAMIDAWLRDFMMHWSSPTPPASEAMAALGLAARLEGGRTKRRVRLACLPVRGDELPDELRDWPEPGRELHPRGSAPVPPVDHA